MEKMSLYHPSIIKLSNRKFSKMNFNLVISVFGMNKGVKIFKGNFNHRSATDYILTNASSNLILSQEIKDKFEAKNKEFTNLTKRILYRLNKEERKGVNCKSKNPSKGSYQSNFFRRYKNQSTQINYRHYIINIILLQKNIRGYLIRKNILQVINHIIKEKSTQCIISVQSLFRQYSKMKKTKVAAFHKRVINIRKECCLMIIALLYSYNQTIKEKKRKIIDILLEDRKKKIILIQSTFQKAKLMKLVKAIIAYEKNNYVLTYPFYAKQIQIKLFLNTNFGTQPQYKFIIPIAPKYKLYSFEFCHLRQMFVLYIKKEEVGCGKYRCQLIVDGCITCDGRFPHIECEDGQFYNLIEFNQGRVVPTGEINGFDNDSKDSGSDKNNNKRYISSDEEDKMVYATLKKNLEANPPNCFYNKKWIKNVCLDYANENQNDFFSFIKKLK